MIHFIFTFLSALSFLIIVCLWTTVYSQSAEGDLAAPLETGPILNDSSLKLQTVFKNNGKLNIPTTGMAFLGPNDILVLEKDKGTVRRIIDNKLQNNPLLKVNTNGTEIEWGMLGIGVSKSGKDTYIFLLFTEAENDRKTKDILGNRLYRYEYVDNRLVNPFLLLDLPAKSLMPAKSPIGAIHNHTGGKVVIGPDENVYVSVGDVGGRNGQAQNNITGDPLDSSSGILRVTQDGNPVGNGILGDTDVLRLYYAYGIRNSFGFDFDPVAGNVWITENGVDDNDEVNLVKPGFNSGWKQVMGIAPKGFDPTKLVDFNGNGKYSDPEFVWNQTVGPTDLRFLDSNKLGSKYKNTMFIGDYNNGYLYNFKLNPERVGLVLEGQLSNRIADAPNEQQSIIFGQGFGAITDIEVGPDGFLYILGFDGTIYRIMSN